MISEVIESGDVLLFIDEIHTIIGAGGAEGALDASNILKPSLARGELQLIGATTINEYRKYIEKDSALERRFQPVTVDEPTEEESLAILKGLRSRYESHHKVEIDREYAFAHAHTGAGLWICLRLEIRADCGASHAPAAQHDVFDAAAVSIGHGHGV